MTVQFNNANLLGGGMRLVGVEPNFTDVIVNNNTARYQPDKAIGCVPGEVKNLDSSCTVCIAGTYS